MSDSSCVASSFETGFSADVVVVEEVAVELTENFSVGNTGNSNILEVQKGFLN